MSAIVSERAAFAGTGNGGVPARRAVVRWAWRLFRREWRQQLLTGGMLTVAVAATIAGAGVATNTPSAHPNAATFGTASSLVTLPGADPRLAADIADLTSRYGLADVIENQTLATGTAQHVDLRAQNPAGRYGAPMLALVQGSYPAKAGQAALTSQVASLYGVHVGSSWHADGRAWQVTGIVENPGNLLDEFALVTPGQVTAPTQVTILLGAKNVTPPQGGTVEYPSGASSGIPPATIVLVVAVLGLIFIGLVAVAGFTVMAQRRLRALGMLAALGATERNVRLVMIANGAVVGVAAAIAGAALGFGAWFAYVPRLETSTAHRIDPMNLPWWAIAAGLVLAVLTAIIAARRPARVVARIPVLAALSGRPADPKAASRSARGGIVAIAAGLGMLAFSGGWGGNGGADTLFLLGGLVACIAGCILLAPPCVAALAAAAGPRAPVAARIALRDLVRYRARSGAALAAVSFAVFLAVLIAVIASVRFANVLDWTGPNLTSSQLIVYTPYGNPNQGGPLTTTPTQGELNAIKARVDTLAGQLHAQSVLALDSASTSMTDPTATLVQSGRQNNNYSGPLYVATPALLSEYGIKASQINPDTDVLTMRPGLATEPRIQLVYGNYQFGPGQALVSPKMQAVSTLPSGTSAPNTVITEHAVQQLHLTLISDGWLIQAAKPLTATQISTARQLASGADATIETKSGELGLTEIADGATAIGILVALGVLAMTVGLIRSETARDLRTLTATGAGSTTRRTLTSVTAAALGLLGALLGTAVACAAAIAWARSSLTATFGNVPAVDFLVILIGLPLVAAAAGWLLAGRQPPVISRQPLD
jgi:putative ABC transport system permease protein